MSRLLDAVAELEAALTRVKTNEPPCEWPDAFELLQSAAENVVRASKRPTRRPKK